jgi:integrase/recombinase XerC
MTAAALSASDAELVQRYLQHVQVEKRLAARTLALYTIDLDKLAAAAVAARVSLTEVQTHHVRRWVAHMHAGGRSGRGIALILSGWRGFYVWLGRMGIMAHNPVQDVRAPKAPKPLPKALGVDEAMQLVTAPLKTGGESGSPHLDGPQEPVDAVQAARDQCIVELLYGSGLRLGELLGLDVTGAPPSVGWVDADAAEVHVLGKGSKRRTVPVGGPALQALAAWLSVRDQWLPAGGVTSGSMDDGGAFADGQRALFINRRGKRLSPQQTRLALRQRSLQAGLATPVHPHMLRHSFASHVLQSSGDLRAVQELLGHAHIATTQVYTRLDFQHLAKAYDAAHPRAGRKGSGSS